MTKKGLHQASQPNCASCCHSAFLLLSSFLVSKKQSGADFVFSGSCWWLLRWPCRANTHRREMRETVVLYLKNTSSLRQQPTSHNPAEAEIQWEILLKHVEQIFFEAFGLSNCADTEITSKLNIGKNQQQMHDCYVMGPKFFSVVVLSMNICQTLEIYVKAKSIIRIYMHRIWPLRLLFSCTSDIF